MWLRSMLALRQGQEMLRLKSAFVNTVFCHLAQGGQRNSGGSIQQKFSSSRGRHDSRSGTGNSGEGSAARETVRLVQAGVLFSFLELIRSTEERCSNLRDSVEKETEEHNRLLFERKGNAEHWEHMVTKYELELNRFRCYNLRHRAYDEIRHDLEYAKHRREDANAEYVKELEGSQRGRSVFFGLIKV